MNTRIIIAGSRTFTDYSLLTKTLKEIIKLHHFKREDVEIISGTANGADQLGERFAKANNIKLSRFPADWDKYGKRAGYIRNKDMALYACQEYGILIAFWDGTSKGTKHMMDIANGYNMEVHIVNFSRNKCGEALEMKVKLENNI